MFDKRHMPCYQSTGRRLGLETLESRRVLAASVGWDGPGLGHAELTYYIANTPSSLSKAATTAAIEKAFAAWSSVADIKFTPTNKPGLNDSIDISFRRLDGSGGTLAQAYFPKDVNRSRLAGDVQFDSSEVWEVGNSLGNRAMDLVWVAVHEIGHSLGLDHKTAAGSVLAASVSPNQSFKSLAAVDIAAIRSLYAAVKSANLATNLSSGSQASTTTNVSSTTNTTTTFTTSETDETDTTSTSCHGGGSFVFGLLSPTASQFITRYDTNKDGSLTQDELPSKIWRLLVDKAIDTDSNAIMSATELDTAIEAARTEKFTAKDSDSNGLLSQSEVGDRTWKKISAADTNGDSSVSIDELKTFIAANPTLLSGFENHSHHRSVDQALSQFQSRGFTSRSARGRR